MNPGACQGHPLRRVFVVLDAFVSPCAVTVFVVLVCACIVIGVAAGFQNIVETDQVALNVDIRMIDRIADAGLCGRLTTMRTGFHIQCF